ncbi:conserved hypothetical protein [Nitrospina gracilis 3/211]|uniref:Uncharacterized protein n=1 Tax=Nitrospina gracilis (strain 3/211) TaxID=1266370 RepID=M1YWR6_NITG3|nr:MULTISPECIES: hypothetical protein [Nitrospina]MCF8723074.1 hypothetical protein [Nitrospina sp. Nb-3]CCQ90111.1 conserved hypothetical protein [Nitrospina gracilis 3/211]
MKSKIPNEAEATRTRDFILLVFWMILGVFLATVATSPAETMHKNPVGIGDPWSNKKIIEARNAVELAWEVYHHAALGGTLASPSIQTQLESNLHECRHLLAEAYTAAENRDWKQVGRFHQQILTLSHHVVEASQEPKR